MEVKTFFFDTYAFFEIISGNPAYLPYSKGVGIITSVLNLMELYYGLSATRGRETALGYFRRYLDYAVPLDFDVVPPAMDFRLEHKRMDFSYADAVGYALANRQGVKFLTGDKSFKGIPNVEFVK